MEALKERIRCEGRVLDDEILLVDGFVNHQIDMALIQAAGQDFAAHFKDQGITRVLTVESSGIAPAGQTALCLGVPLVVIKKKDSRIMDASVHQTQVHSFTKGAPYQMTLARRFLPAGERVLFIDDFLAMGEAALGVSRLVEAAGARLAGIGVLIEKAFQPGREKLEVLGHEVYALARIGSMSGGTIEFLDNP